MGSDRMRSMKTNEKFNERLLRLRKEKNLTAKFMAHAIEVPESTYREWEYGRGMRLPPCQKISQVLGVSLSELMTGERPDGAKITAELERIENLVQELRLNLSSLI